MRRILLFIFLLSYTATSFALSPSGTLPVMYITTKNNQAVSRDQAVDATLYVTAYGSYPATGSVNNQIPLTIKGRGNWTWTAFDKKPYKIVFAKGHGQKLLGMHKSKHWALLAGADDWLGYLRNTVGYFLSQRIGLPYTPQQVPVELVLNGEYQGLYFVTETIRIDNDRVNIHEQNDGDSDPSIITGGWLVEIDNYSKEGNITFEEHNGQWIMITPESPEELSSAQRNYITGQMHALNDAIYNKPFAYNGGQSTDLTDILDIPDAARFYLVQEIMEDCESYHGSCYLYKDRDTLSPFNSHLSIQKWHFGPVWDFGNAFNRHQEQFIYDNPTFSQIWIEQLCQHKIFYEQLMQLWKQYRAEGHNKVLADIDAFVSLISSAAKRDAERWKNSDNVCDNSDMSDRKQDFLNRMNWRLDWLYSQWGDGDVPFSDVQQPSADQPRKATINLVGGQLFIERDGKRYTLTGVPIN